MGLKMVVNNKAKALEEYDIQTRQDRVGKYFKQYLDSFVFDCLSQNYLSKHKKDEYMKDIPIPIEKEDIAEFKNNGLKIVKIAQNMAWVIGINPHFTYTSQYVRFLKTYYHNKIIDILVKQGKDAAEDENFDKAAILFRSALCISPTNLHALYGYARVCREQYSQSENEEYVGRFKAESLEYFEMTRELHPKFAQSYYYLGYAYLNMGLYMKAHLTWKEFMGKSLNSKDKKEIKERLEQIAEPIEIEKGYNAILAGRWTEGVTILEPYLDSRFNDWWPLSYYLGIGYLSLGKRDEAEACFKHVLTLQPSHAESMDELADIYRIDGDKLREEKYRKKAALVRAGGYEEKAFKSKTEE